MIYIVDSDRDRTLIHRIDLEDGEYLTPRVIKYKSLDLYAGEIMYLVEKEKPTQIIFDNIGFGNALSDTFKTNLRTMRALFELDSKGNIEHMKK